MFVADVVASFTVCDTTVMTTYRVYVDDSGTKEYASPGEEYGRHGGKSRYFVWGGLLMDESKGGAFADAIAEAKRRTFGTADVEIKSNWLRFPRERERRYLQAFGISEDAIRHFVAEFYDLIAQADLMLIAAVVDKVRMQETYRNPWYAPTAAYEALMQRVVQEVRLPDTVSVTMDDMTGATPSGNQYKENLKRHHESLVRNGSSLLRTLDFRSLRDLRFGNSAHSHLLQVADVAAYNVYRQFLDHGDAWEEHAERLATYEWFLKLGAKFRQGPNGRIQGFGVAKFPLRTRIPWRYRHGQE
jgi:hypothetical protein